VPAQKRVNPSNETRDEHLEGGVTTMNDLMGGIPEIEVDAIQGNPQPQGVPLVVIRVNEAIEEMSYVAGGRRERYSFEAGNQYRVPVYIADELEGLGKIWH